MALIHERSCPCSKSELDLFTAPYTQIAVESGSWIVYHPISSLTDQSPIEFFISGSGEDYLDLANTLLYRKVRVLKGNGDNTDAAEDIVAPVNLFGQALISQMDVFLNEVLISSANNTYPYRAYLETLLTPSQEKIASQYGAAIWKKDTAGEFDNMSAEGRDGRRNTGFSMRYRRIQRSRPVELTCRLHSDIFSQHRYMLNNVDVRLKLSRTKDTFSLMADAADGTYKVNIMPASLWVRKVKLAPSILMAHEKR